MQIVSRVVSSLLLGLALAAPVSAQVCGNGIVELGESCDDGNLAGGDCCSPTCVRAAAGEPCRAAVDACDAVEVCDGISSFCPPDTGLAGDADDDEVCDLVDDCPDVPDPAQLDRDLDGLGDACDPCTNLLGTQVTGARLRLRKLDLPFGSGRVKLRGDLVVASSPPINPVANGIRLVITDETGLVALDVTVPGGAFDTVARRGWTTNRAGSVFRYTDRAGTVGGIKRVLVKRRGPGALHVVALGRDGEYLPPASAVVDVAIVVDPPLGETQCGEAHFGEGSCRYRNEGGKLVCH